MPINRGSKSLVYSEQFYYPDGWGGAQFPLDITTHLAANGWRVDVVCGSEPYQPGEPEGPDPADAGIRVHRVPRLFFGDIHRFKLLRHIWYYACSVPMLTFRKTSLYATQTNPPFIVPLIALIAMLRRRPFVIIVQDLYPDVLLATLSRPWSAFAGFFLRPVFRWAFRRARSVVCVGPRMSARLRDNGAAKGEVTFVSNWATGKLDAETKQVDELRANWGLDGKIVVLYSGNLGKVHDIETAIRAFAAALRHESRLCLLIVGSGSRLREARELACSLRLERAVQFRPPQSAAYLSICHKLANIAFVTLDARYGGLSVPSKLLGYLARGLPIVYIGPDGDVVWYMEESKCGTCFANGDTVGVSKELLRLCNQPDYRVRLGESGARFYREKLQRNGALIRYETTFVHALGSRA